MPFGVSGRANRVPIRVSALASSPALAIRSASLAESMGFDGTAYSALPPLLPTASATARCPGACAGSGGAGARGSVSVSSGLATGRGVSGKDVGIGRDAGGASSPPACCVPEGSGPALAAATIYRPVLWGCLVNSDPAGRDGTASAALVGRAKAG
jgi:hypothetical protein